MKKKVGLMGGSFNPVHVAHLVVMEQACHQLGLDEGWFLPSNHPPHKDESEMASGEHRLKMLRRAISTHPKWKICLLEFEREGPSFTVDTMDELNRRYPDIQFYFILGGDMVEYLSHWHRIDELKKMVRFVGTQRPGFTLDHGVSDLHLEIVEVPQLDISSSLIRRWIKRGFSIQYLVPDAVKQYIEEEGLYG
ncbi:nicotinate-nucleotide adenylyltransferase [Microaerobacter geothermalis]|uniref:nicotinate-nucleotide adenylyltransferase n=1 Tax=Microaerobacter geothermalis TaxID=674972 RepID=UPI001F23F4B2|nr:nicotinate-nucleotide adenylyltransferase [Microaerobacter geothermalis]MCF6092905.1 nicotinate-nucleotide adenylyltransferase [Microaerobacter geothermalis]